MAVVHIGIRMLHLCVSAVCRQVCVLLVCSGVGCGGWRGLPVRRHSYGHRVELWRAFDSLNNDKKQLKVKQSRRTQVHLGFIRPKTGTMRFGPMAGLVGCVFDMILIIYLFLAPNGPDMPVFGCCPLLKLIKLLKFH